MTTKPPLTLFEPEELARLAERARLDVHGGIKGEPVKKGVKLSTSEEIEMDRRAHARLVRGLAGLRLAARCYALARDPAGLTPIVWGAWAVNSWRDAFETHVDSADRIATAVASVGPRLLEVPGLAEQLARSSLVRVRRALAEALPERPASEPLLRALAQDDDAEVRQAARAKIADDDRWGGAFPIPPGDHPDEALHAARVVLERSVYDRSKAPEEAVRAFAPLSDALAVACWERVLAPFSVGGEALKAWLACLLDRPGGGAALTRLLAVWARIGKGYFVDKLIDEVRERLSEDTPARAFREILQALRALKTDELGQDEPELPRFYRVNVAKAAVALAPAQGDARELLETILGCPIERASEEACGERERPEIELSSVLARWPLDEASRATLVEARRAGTPGRWARVGRAVWDGLGPDPVLRERARRDLEHESGRSAAITALLGPLHDPAEDGDVEAAARALYARPELRSAVVWNADSILPQARRDLEAGELDLEVAIAVLQRTPPDEQTDAMWAAARALRDRAVADPADTRWIGHRVSETLIRGGDEWDPSDLAYARAVVERAFRGDRHPGFVAFLIPVLERKVNEESEALLREIDARATTDQLRKIVDAGRQISAALRDIGH